MIFLGIADQTDSGFFSQTASSVMNSSSSSMSDSFLRRRWMLSNSDFSSSNHQIVRVLSSYSFSTVVCVCTDMGFSKGTKLVFKNSFAKNSGFFIWTIIFWSLNFLNLQIVIQGWAIELTSLQNVILPKMGNLPIVRVPLTQNTNQIIYYLKCLMNFGHNSHFLLNLSIILK